MGFNVRRVIVIIVLALSLVPGVRGLWDLASAGEAMRERLPLNEFLLYPRALVFDRAQYFTLREFDVEWTDGSRDVFRLDPATYRELKRAGIGVLFAHAVNFSKQGAASPVPQFLRYFLCEKRYPAIVDSPKIPKIVRVRMEQPPYDSRGLQEKGIECPR